MIIREIIHGNLCKRTIIMKKTYILPTTRSFYVDAEPIMAGADSITVAGNTSDLTPEEGKVYGDVKGASYNVWNDDWSE